MARKKKPGAHPAAQPGSSEAGHEVRPDALPAEPAEESGGAAPLGLPIPLEQYKALQEAARRRKAHPPGVAQEDPGGP